MWQSLQQQGVPKQMTIVTGLANRESYDALGPLVQGITLVSHYVYQAPHNPANTYMTKWLRRTTAACRTSSRRTASSRRR